ncbi:hypothetical protein NFI96_023887 [Prochilodus magdalenae]|nr:hypothetical protein NFI96_023887 [Prochilodus magdalenae]
MSQPLFLTTRERKMQAAAICREIHGAHESDVDVGRKVNAPKEIMLEELSLASNRGSRLFKMRQKRSEKYTFEKIQNEANAQINNTLIPPVPSTEATNMKTNINGVAADQAPQPSNTSDPCTNPGLIAPGYGGPLKDVPAEKFNRTAIPKSYHSPWEQALSRDPSLADTLLVQMPEPEPRPEIPEYKSFNRVATPFGGFGKAPKVPVKPLEVDVVPGIPNLPPPAPPADQVSTRPSFNRTALGWVAESTPAVLSTISLESMSSVPAVFMPESDEL